MPETLPELEIKINFQSYDSKGELPDLEKTNSKPPDPAKCPGAAAIEFVT